MKSSSGTLPRGDGVLLRFDLVLWMVPLVILVGVACSRYIAVPRPSDPEEALRQALVLREARKFKQAQEAFTNVIFSFPGSSQASDAQYYLAESHLAAKDFVAAQTEYDFYLSNFPNGQFQERATFERALSYLRAAPGHDRDQTSVRKAREMLEDFLSAYPETGFRSEVNQALVEIDTRLVRKEIEAARVYFKSGEFKAALVYYEYVRSAYPNVKLSSIDRYRLAVSYMETGYYSSARSLLTDIVANETDARLRLLAENRLARLPPPY